MDRGIFIKLVILNVLRLAENEKWTDVVQCYEG